MTPETVDTIRHALTQRVNLLDDAAREAEAKGNEGTAAILRHNRKRARIALTEFMEVQRNC